MTVQENIEALEGGSGDKALDHAKQRQKGALLSYAYTAATVIVGFLYVPLLLSTIGDSEYGLYQLIGSIMAYMSLMNSVFSAGITRYYCSYLVTDDEESMAGILAAGKRIYTFMSVAAVAVGSLVAFAFGQIYANALTEFQIMQSYAMIAMLVVNLVIMMQNSLSAAVVTAHERFVFQKSLQLISLIAQPAIVAVMVQFFPYAMTVPACQLLLNAILALAQRVYARQVLGMKVKTSPDMKDITRSLIVFSGGMLLALLADQLFWKTNQLILGLYFGTVVVAVYAVASQVVTIYMSLGIAFSSVFLPRVTELYLAGEVKGKLSDLLIKVGRLSLYPLMLVFTGFAVFGIDFLRLWAGDGYDQGYGIALILMAALTIDLAQTLGLTVLQAANRYHIRGIVYFALAVFNAVLVYLFAPIWGPFGCAACSSLAMLVGNGLIMNIYYSKVIGLRIGDFWKQIVRMVAPLLAFGLLSNILVSLLDPACTWFALCAGVVIYTICFSAIAYLWSMNSYERNLVRSFTRKIIGGIRSITRKRG